MPWKSYVRFNDTWYFEICPKEGWYSKSQLWLNSLLGALLAVLIAMLYWQRGMRSYKGGALRRRNQKVGRGSEGGEHCEDRIPFPDEPRYKDTVKWNYRFT